MFLGAAAASPAALMTLVLELFVHKSYNAKFWFSNTTFIATIKSKFFLRKKLTRPMK